MALGFAQHLRMWWEWPLVVIDFETCGVDPATCAPVEIAAVRFERGEPVHSLAALIKPDCPIPADATAIHGITDEMVLCAGDFDDAWYDITGRYIIDDDAIPVAYNAPFDRTILHRVAWPRPEPGYSLPALDTDLAWLDPLVAVRHFDKYAPGKGRHRLSATCARRGIPLPTAHRALGDAEACGRLLYSMRAEIGDMTISELLRRQELRRAEQDQERAAYLATLPATAAQAESGAR